MTMNPDQEIPISPYTIGPVPAHMIAMIWDKVEPHIQRVVDVAHDEVTLTSVKNRLLNGNTMLITISEGSEIIACNVLELRVFESGKKVMCVPITGGTDLDGWMPQFLEVAKRIARDYECDTLQGLSVRKGWMKKLKPYGWREVHMVIECDVNEE